MADVGRPDGRQILLDLFDSTAAAAGRHDWKSAIALAHEAGALAERINEPYLLHDAARALQRLEVFDRAWELYRGQDRLLCFAGKPEWDGTDLAGGTLLIRSGEYQIGDLIRFARLIGYAKRRAGTGPCIVLTEDKLVGLLRRNFPDVTFDVEGRSHDVFSSADVVASFNTLCTHFANDWQAIVRSFTPLMSDPRMTADLRRHYSGNSGRPLVGVSWWSSNKEKDFPSIGDWLAFLHRFPATFVSLQYGDAAEAADQFRAVLGDRFFVDADIDPTGDRDRFAAQIAALDAVVTIPQTCAHFSGALDIPTIVLLDDRFHLSWPQISAETPWCPKTAMMRKRNRPWSDVMRVAADRLTRLVTRSVPHI